MVRLRPCKDEYFLAMAVLVAARSTCSRRSVGCVLVDSRNHVLATGYNGVASGVAHCIDTHCPGADLPSGTGLDKCEAIHAEQNAILQCKDVGVIETAYITTSPCHTCTKLLMNTGCSRIVFLKAYTDESPKELWKGEWIEHGPIKYVFTQSGLETANRSTRSEQGKGNIIGRGDKRSKPSNLWSWWSKK